MNEGVTARTDPIVLMKRDRAVESNKSAVSHAEAIKKYKVLTSDFTIENNYLTPSLKVKRADVLQDFAGAIDEIYEGPEPAE